MKQILSIILAVVLICSVAGTVTKGTIAGFLDTEVSTNNFMCAGHRNLELSGGPIAVKCAMPSKWYSEEFTLTNAGSLDGLVTVHIPLEDDTGGEWKGLECVEAGANLGQVWDEPATRDAVGDEPVGLGVATSEPELTAEEDGRVGQTTVFGLGTDAGGDTGPTAWLMSKYVDVRMWYDENEDGNFSGDELVVEDKLFNVACTKYELGVIPASSEASTKGGGWGSSFQYTISSSNIDVPLIAGQNWTVGMVSIWHDANYLYVDYDTTYSGWQMEETHVYVGSGPPPELSPGRFPYKHEKLGCATTDSYKIPLDWSGTVYIATHAAGCDKETAWAKGIARNFKIELHLPQIEDPDWDGVTGVDYDLDGDIDRDDAQKRWWLTDAFQGDKCTFDIVFTLQGNDSSHEGSKPKGK